MGARPWISDDAGLVDPTQTKILGIYSTHKQLGWFPTARRKSSVMCGNFSPLRRFSVSSMCDESRSCGGTNS